MNNFSVVTVTKDSPQLQCPRLAVTLGDPAGIGSEVVLKALADPMINAQADFTIFGCRSLLQATYNHLLTQDPTLILADPADLSILDVCLNPEIQSQITLSHENAAGGALSFAYMETAITHTLAGNFQGIITAPISKSAWKAAGYHYPGQTELLAQRAGVEKFGMLFVARSPYTNWIMRTLLATTHIPLSEVSKVLTPELLTTKLDLLIECLGNDFGIKNPKIAIAGLNPHSGEQGQLGREEIDWLIPWMQKEQKKRLNVQLEGPIPPDTMWVKPGQAWFGKMGELEPKIPLNSADGYLALYHDQGLIPVKLMAFDRAVNTSIGLPFIRTSPDHGTAFDIAGKGVANPTSMKAALSFAVELSQQKNNNEH